MLWGAPAKDKAAAPDSAASADAAKENAPQTGEAQTSEAQTVKASGGRRGSPPHADERRRPGLRPDADLREFGAEARRASGLSLTRRAVPLRRRPEAESVPRPGFAPGNSEQKGLSVEAPMRQDVRPPVGAETCSPPERPGIRQGFRRRAGGEKRNHAPRRSSGAEALLPEGSEPTGQQVPRLFSAQTEKRPPPRQGCGTSGMPLGMSSRIAMKRRFVFSGAWFALIAPVRGARRRRMRPQGRSCARLLPR